jgi:hypothetical protein
MIRIFSTPVLGAAAVLASAGITASALSGCAFETGEEGSSDEPLSVNQQPFSGMQAHLKSTTISNVFTLNQVAGHACFLTGVGGRLSTHGNPQHGARIGVSGTGTNYTLVLNTSTGSLIRAGAACVTPVSGLTSTVTWNSTSGSPAVVAAAVPGRACFLTQITSAVSSSSGESFDSSSDQVGLEVQNGQWVLTGSTQHGRIDAAARCLNVSYSQAWTGTWTGSGSTSFNMDLMTPASSGACFMTKIKGAFLSTDPVDGVQNLVTSGGQWSMELKNNKSGWANCVK